MRTCGILFFLSFSVFAQEPDFHYKAFSIKVDSVTSGAEIRKIQTFLALEKDPEKQALLKKALQDYQWLDGLRKNRKVILVNIPSANMRVFEDAKEVSQMRVILGKKKSPTRTLLSKVDELTINPYWFITRRMATVELLPKIRKNPQFLADNQIRVLDAKYQVINAHSINWSRLSTHYFPYILRQNSGENNALGALKFHFNNPFSLYLHDTDSKQLFKQPNRFYSHTAFVLKSPKN
jgi:murein L,D-transpeptidase YcbB/YkuD